MKSKDVQVGKTYIVKVSGKLVPVLLENASPDGGWNGRNIDTQRAVRVRSAARLRGEYQSAGAAPEAPAPRQPAYVPPDGTPGPRSMSSLFRF